MPARYLLTSENKVCMLPPWGSYSFFCHHSTPRPAGVGEPEKSKVGFALPETVEIMEWHSGFGVLQSSAASASSFISAASTGGD